MPAKNRRVECPAAKARYDTRRDARRTSAYTVAIADYMHAPEIAVLDTRAYHGLPGDPIHIQATDDFEVTAVFLRLLLPDGTLLEEGPAYLQPRGHWRYLARQARPSGFTLTCEATAHDRPGNHTRHAVML